MVPRRVGPGAGTPRRWRALDLRASGPSTHVLERIRAGARCRSLDFERKPAIDWCWGPTARSARCSRRSRERRGRARAARGQPPLLRPGGAAVSRRSCWPSVHPSASSAATSCCRATGRTGCSGDRARRSCGTAPARPAGHPTDPPGHADPGGAAGGAHRGRRAAAGRASRASRARATSLGHETRDCSDEAHRSARARARGDASSRRSTRSSGTATCCAACSASTTSGRCTSPEHKRRWGYYVLPILFGDRLVGRIEPRIDRATGSVRILGLWWEDGFDPRTTEGFVPAMRRALAAYLRFGTRPVDRVGAAPGRRTSPHRGQAPRLTVRPVASGRTGRPGRGGASFAVRGRPSAEVQDRPRFTRTARMAVVLGMTLVLALPTATDRPTCARRVTRVHVRAPRRSSTACEYPGATCRYDA